MDTETAYQQALDYLYSFVDYSLKKNFQLSPEKFNLERMRAFMRLLGDPQTSYPILHVAGTKGKGSVSALCASALRAQGYRTGLYTSPHLQEYTERIQVDGEAIPAIELVNLIEEIKPKVDQVPELTTFEITTALGFLYFARQKVDAAVIEVGLGGRLDATNICSPAVAVITSLSYDHTSVLGSTLTEIAGEKAGIIKPGVPVVSAPQKDEAAQVIQRVAMERGSPLKVVGQDFRYQILGSSLQGQQTRVWQVGREDEAALLFIPLLGSHQAENAATAWSALQAANASGLKVETSAIQAGFRNVAWPGRFEILQMNPTVIIDSAHNPHSAQKLRETLDEHFPSSPVVLIFGASEDKDIAGMFAELLPRVKILIATKSEHPRAIEPEMLVEMAKPYGIESKPVKMIEAALDEALRYVGEEPVILAAGSVFIAAAVRHAWQARPLD